MVDLPAIRRIVTENRRYFQFSPNKDSEMISSLPNYRPFFSPFPHIPPAREPFVKVVISMHKVIMAVAVEECSFAQILEPDRSEMEIRAFASIKKVTWDKLLVSKAEIILK